MRFSWYQKHPINISLKGHFLKRTFPKAVVRLTSTIIVLCSGMLLRRDFRPDGTVLNATRASNTPFLGKRYFPKWSAQKKLYPLNGCRRNIRIECENILLYPQRALFLPARSYKCPSAQKTLQIPPQKNARPTRFITHLVWYKYIFNQHYQKNRQKKALKNRFSLSNIPTSTLQRFPTFLHENPKHSNGNPRQPPAPLILHRSVAFPQKTVLPIDAKVFQ